MALDDILAWIPPGHPDAALVREVKFDRLPAHVAIIMQVKEKMLLAGFVVLMMLMVTVIYNDLTRISWIERLMPWRN